MKKIHLSNFRKIRTQWSLDLAPITFFTGTNNSGKSSVLKSLLLLSDYGVSKNHLQLSFGGENHRSHKIDCFSNAVNWTNQKGGNWKIGFNFSNKGHSVHVYFTKPISSANIAKISIGELTELHIIREQDGAQFNMSNLGSGNYQIKLEERFLNQTDNKKDEKELVDLTKIYKGLTSEIESLHTTIETMEVNDPKRINLNQNLQKLEKNQSLVIKQINNLKKDYAKDYSGIVYTPTFNVDEIDTLDLTIDRIVRIVLMRYFQTEEKKIGKSSLSSERIRLMRSADQINNILNFAVDHLSPHRNSQARLHLNDEHTNDINDIINEYAKLPFKKNSKAGVFLKEWMQIFDIGSDFKIRSIEGMASIVEIEEDGEWLNLVDKGFGAGQIFTVLLKIAQCIEESNIRNRINHRFRNQDNTRIILIEEPEANLHPLLQSKLADLFYYAYTHFDIRFIVETHSEYILRRTQLIVKDIYKNDEKEENPFEVYYFDKNKGPYPMGYRKDGVFKENFGPGFFDIASQHALELIKRSN